MKIGWKSVAWSAAALLLLLSIPTKLVVVTLFLLMVPVVVLYTVLKPASFALHLIGIGIAAYLLLGTYSLVSLTFGLFFLIPSIVMGHMYKKHLSARTIITATSLILLAQLLVELVIFSVQYDMDLSSQLSTLFEEGLLQLQTSASGALLPADWAHTTAASLSDAITKMLPSLLVLTSFLLAAIGHIFTRQSLKLIGVVAPAMTPMKNWRLPRSLIFFYLIAIIITISVSPDSGSFWSLSAFNAVPVLRFAFTAQAIAFFFYLADAKKWPRIVPILIAVPLVMFPQTFYLIGLIDTAFPLRKYFVK
ncbi:DUF2232 domain-containing protein [Cohnella zeiphila]|uniref:DUF2232 domain-containing protein n=1 Tax=Cohnella zeiphila TaxID=2761120 RepID=A0A7X0ST86_9BACL|nr:DUF2232 domain-containing protein [Cohnella zeiphila]MBB6735724.1 DUF2232 domain-containing protein [Cohnella zeiphila]